MPGIEVQGLVKRFGPVTAVDGISFDIPDGSFTTFLGPSGCGKTTTLRMLAGLERPDDGEIRIGARVVASSKDRVFVPIEDRGVGIVFQSYALWPHMTVFDHVAYPLRVRKHRSAGIRDRVGKALEMVDLVEQRNRFPSEISGGQQQRVALARALVFDPSVLFLDEPLSNLDAALRSMMRAELKRLHQETGVTTVYVTHDQTEALALSDQIMVMRHGSIMEQGPPVDVYERPKTLYGTRFVGAANCLSAELTEIHGNGARVMLSTGELLLVPSEGLASGDVGNTVTVVVRPEDVILAGGESDNRIEGVITQRTYLGSHVELTVAAAGDMIRVRAPRSAVGERPDDRVSLHLPYELLRAHTETLDDLALALQEELEMEIAG